MFQLDLFLTNYLYRAVQSYIGGGTFLMSSQLLSSSPVCSRRKHRTNLLGSRLVPVFRFTHSSPSALLRLRSACDRPAIAATCFGLFVRFHICCGRLSTQLTSTRQLTISHSLHIASLPPLVAGARASCVCAAIGSRCRHYQRSSVRSLGFFVVGARLVRAQSVRICWPRFSIELDRVWILFLVFVVFLHWCVLHFVFSCR